MAHLKKRYLKNRRKADAAFAKGKDATKFLHLKYYYWHRLYKTTCLWQ